MTIYYDIADNVGKNLELTSANHLLWLHQLKKNSLPWALYKNIQ